MVMALWRVLGVKKISMSISILKSKKWGLVGAFVGALLFPALSLLMGVAGHFIRVIIGI